jgi:hypothetical protein
MKGGLLEDYPSHSTRKFPRGGLSIAPHLEKLESVKITLTMLIALVDINEFEDE